MKDRNGFQVICFEGTEFKENLNFAVFKVCVKVISLPKVFKQKTNQIFFALLIYFLEISVTKFEFS